MYYSLFVFLLNTQSQPNSVYIWLVLHIRYHEEHQVSLYEELTLYLLSKFGQVANSNRGGLVRGLVAKFGQGAGSKTAIGGGLG